LRIGHLFFGEEALFWELGLGDFFFGHFLDGLVLQSGGCRVQEKAKSTSPGEPPNSRRRTRGTLCARYPCQEAGAFRFI